MYLEIATFDVAPIGLSRLCIKRIPIFILTKTTITFHFANETVYIYVYMYIFARYIVVINVS